MTINKAVKSSEYHNYVPGVRQDFVRSENWNSLTIDTFLFPSLVDDVEAPSLDEHTYVHAGSLGVKRNQELYRGELKLDRKLVYTGKKYQGSAYLIPRMTSASWNWRSPSRHGFVGSCTYFSQALLATVAERTLGMKNTQVELMLNLELDDDFLLQIVCELSKDAKQASPINRLYAESLTQMFAVHVVKNYCLQQPRLHLAKKSLSPIILNRVTEYIHEHIEEPLSLIELAGVASLSEYYFIRLFKQATGQTPHQYVLTLRMQRAKVLLSNSERTIVDIAFSSGYANPGNFTQAFKRNFGLTPREYRRQEL